MINEEKKTSLWFGDISNKQENILLLHIVSKYIVRKYTKDDMFISNIQNKT